MISPTSPSAWLLKNLQLNCKLNTGHIHKIKGLYKSYILEKLKNAKNRQELHSKYMNWLVLPLILYDCLKTWNWIASWMLNTLMISNMLLKATIYSFQTSLRLLKLSNNWKIYKLISALPPSTVWSKLWNCSLISYMICP